MYPAPLLVRKIACSLTILLVCTTFAAADDVHWQPTGSHGFDWGTPQNWNPHLPGPGDNVFINLLNAPALNVNATIANLTLQGGVIDTLVAGSQNLTVTGTTTLAPSGLPGTGIYAESDDTFTLGTLTNFSGGVLHGSDDTEYYTFGENGTSATIQFKGAHVIENEAAIYLLGNGRILDQDTGLDAFRDLALNRGQFYINYGGSLTVSGSLTQTGEGAIFVGGDEPESSVVVNGNLTNASEDSGLAIDAPGQVTVTGSIVNYGFLGLRDRSSSGLPMKLTVGGNITNTSSGGMRLDGNVTLDVDGKVLFESQSGMDMGGQPNVNTLYTTKLQIKNGLEFRGAFLTGIGTIFADLIFTQGGSVFSPGNSPGEVTVNGSLSFDALATLRLEIGGLIPGTQHDRVVQHSTGSGGVVLNGNLDLSLVNAFHANIQPTDVFTVLTSDVPLTGAFQNVANAGRLATSDGAGSFRVNYSGNTISVTEFEGAPPPTITSIPVSAVPNSYITVLGTGLIGTTGAQVNGVSTFAFAASVTEVQVLVPLNATSGPITIETNHGTVVSGSSLTILADSDGDGMSDDFELQYFGSTTGGNPNDDSGDGDGKSNLDEFRAGTDPFDANSRLRAIQIRRQGNDIVVVFPSVADKRYRLEASTSPSGDFPLKLTMLPAAPADPAREVADLNGATEPKRFYKVVVLP